MPFKLLLPGLALALCQGALAQSPPAALRLTLWPGGEERLIARVDFHGRWAEWL